MTLDDVFVPVNVAYDRPVLGWDGESGTRMTSEEVVVLGPEPVAQRGDLEQVRTIVDGGVSVTTRFFWPPPPGGIVAGYTAPLVRWVETTIEGITSEPIVLRGDRSQTYRPEHHNIFEHFIFDPRAEDGLPPGVLAELDAKDIGWIHAHTGEAVVWMDVYGACELELRCACGGEPLFRRADTNGDDSIDISDAVHTLLWLFIGGETPGCVAAADTNGDGAVDISDPTYLLGFLFLGGSAPVAPFPGCGPGRPAGEPPCAAPPASCR